MPKIAATPHSTTETSQHVARRTAWQSLHRRYISAREPIDGADVAGIVRNDEIALKACDEFRVAERELLLTAAPDAGALREKFRAFREAFGSDGGLDGDFPLFLASLEVDALRFAELADEFDRDGKWVEEERGPVRAPDVTFETAEHRVPWIDLKGDAVLEDLWRQIEVADLALRGLKALADGSQIHPDMIDAVVDVTGAALGNVERLRGLFADDETDEAI